MSDFVSFGFMAVVVVLGWLLVHLALRRTVKLEGACFRVPGLFEFVVRRFESKRDSVG